MGMHFICITANDYGVFRAQQPWYCKPSVVMNGVLGFKGLIVIVDELDMDLEELIVTLTAVCRGEYQWIKPMHCGEH